MAQAKPQSKAPELKPVQPQEEHEKQIVIPVTIKLGKAFYAKLPFLIALLFFFSFSMVMFDKSNFKTTDLFDLSRLEFNVGKLYSISFILFLVLLAASIALSMYYSAGINFVPSMLVVLATFIPALLLGALAYPWLMSTFLAFAAAVSFCGILSSFSHEITIPRAWAILSASMLLLTVLAFLVVFDKVALNKDAHFNLLIDSVLSKAPGSEAIKPALFSIPEFQLLYNRFALLSAVLAAAIAGLAGFVLQVLSLGALFGLNKLLETPKS